MSLTCGAGTQVRVCGCMGTSVCSECVGSQHQQYFLRMTAKDGQVYRSCLTLGIRIQRVVKDDLCYFNFPRHF